MISCCYRAWENYNAEEEIKRLEEQEHEEERARDEVGVKGHGIPPAFAVSKQHKLQDERFTHLSNIQRQVISTAKARAEQDRVRRTKKREDQLRALGKSRFKESLSPFEKARVAEREHMKGNESFKVSLVCEDIAVGHVFLVSVLLCIECG